jgi:heptosyltransferase-2
LSTAIDSRVLVIAPQWVGDAIMSLPLIRQLKQEGHGVDVLATPAVEAVFHCCPDIDQCIVVPFAHGQLQWSLRNATASRLRGRYRKAIVLPNSLKSALVPWLAGIPIRRGATGESRYWLINDRRDLPLDTPHGRGRPSMLDQYLGFADQPIDRKAIDRFGRDRPRMSLPLKATGFGAHGLDDATLNALLGQELLAMCPGAEYGPAKQWPADQFAQSAKAWLAASTARSVIIVGGPKDMAMADAIADKIADGSTPRMAGSAGGKQVINLAGKTSLLEAFHWISRSAMVLANDSGLMHAAAALDVPVVGIFGSSDPRHTPPHAMRSRVLWLGISCSPCFERSCPLGTTACLKELPASMAIDAINELVADAPAVRDAAPPASP